MICIAIALLVVLKELSLPKLYNSSHRFRCVNWHLINEKAKIKIKKYYGALI